MTFGINSYQYIKGAILFVEKFLIFHIGQKNETRVSITKKIIKDKSVVHLGACDHMECIDEKREKGTWMHDIISDSAKAVIGIDINEETVQYCNAVGIKNIFCSDIIKDVDMIRKMLYGGKKAICYMQGKSWSIFRILWSF